MTAIEKADATSLNMNFTSEIASQTFDLLGTPIPATPKSRDPFFDPEATVKPNKRLGFNIKSPFKPSFRSFMDNDIDGSQYLTADFAQADSLHFKVINASNDTFDQLTNHHANRLIQPELPINISMPIQPELSIDVSEELEISFDEFDSANEIQAGSGVLDADTGTSWFENESPYNMFNGIEELNEIGGSNIIDDFVELQKGMQSAQSKEAIGIHHSLMNEQFLSPGKYLHNLDKLSFLGHDSSEDSILSINDDQSILIESTVYPCEIDSQELQTPHNLRKLPSMIESMTPGTFFAEKSGHLGRLGGIGSNSSVNRPIWFTPKKDILGRTIDNLADSPQERSEKLQPVLASLIQGCNSCWTKKGKTAAVPITIIEKNSSHSSPFNSGPGANC